MIKKKKKKKQEKKKIEGQILILSELYTETLLAVTIAVMIPTSSPLHHDIQSVKIM